MNRCIACGVEISDTMHLCLHHQFHEPGWAATNRIMCDFLHRGLAPPRVRPADREPELRSCLAQVA